MKKGTAVFTSLVLLGSCVACSNPPAARITVTEVVEVMKKALKNAQAALVANGLPPLASATITLQTKLDVKSDINASILVVTADSQGTTSKTQTVSLKMSPPPGNLESHLAAGFDLYTELSKAIQEASKAASEATAAGKPELRLDSVTASIGFDVARSVNGGLSIQVSSIKLGATRIETTTTSNKIDLTFAKPAAAS